jgi:hypothetical protein
MAPRSLSTTSMWLWRRFSDAIRLLKDAKLLRRTQQGQGFAREQLSKHSDNFVEIEERVHHANSRVVAFIVVTNLSPKPLSPAKAAGRFGVTSPTTIRKLVRAALHLDAISAGIGTNGRDAIARKDHIFQKKGHETANFGSANLVSPTPLCTPGFGLRHSCLDRDMVRDSLTRAAPHSPILRRSD